MCTFQPWLIMLYPYYQQPWSTMHYPLYQQPWSTMHYPLYQQPWSTMHYPLNQQPWSTMHYPLYQQPWLTMLPTMVYTLCIPNLLCRKDTLTSNFGEKCFILVGGHLFGVVLF